MSIYMGVFALLFLLAIAGWALWRNGHQHGLGEGMLTGYDEGDRDGFNRGYSAARLDAVLAAPPLATRAGGSATCCAVPHPGEAAFGAALLNDELHDGLHADETFPGAVPAEQWEVAP